MINLKKLENEINGLNTRIDFYQKVLKEALLLGIEDLFDFNNYL